MIKKTICLLLLCFCLTNANTDGKITIQRFGNTVVAYHDFQKQTLFFNSQQTNMNTSAQSNLESRTTIETDKPVYLHSTLQTSLTTIAEDSFMQVSDVESNALVVAVIDSGIDLNNNILQAYLYENANEIPNNLIDDDGNGYIDDVNGINLVNTNSTPQDDLGHGTLISGIIAKNGMGNAIIMPIKAFNDQGISSQFAIATAINYAVAMGADIINCSFGYSYYTEILRLAINNAIENGVIVIASAGNNGKEENIYPAALPGVIAVSALNSDDHLASFSNYGSHIDISCLGVDITSTYLSNQYAKTSGTSISSGYISGIIPYVFSLIDSNSMDQAFSNKAIDLVDPLGTGDNLVGWDKFSGNGKLDISSLVEPQAASANISLSVSSLLNYPNPILNTSGTEFGYYLNQNANVRVNVYSLFGKELWSTSIISGTTGGNSGYNKVSFNCYSNNGQHLPNDTYIVLIYAETNTEKTLARHLFTVAR